MIDVTFGVLNYNPGNNIQAEVALRQCLESLHANINPQISSEVYVIDQASKIHAQQMIIRDYCNDFGWRSLLLEKNVGISRGINMLARIARSKYICLVTSDIVFTENLDISLIHALQSNSNLWQVCPACDNSELEHQRIGYQQEGLAYTLAAQELAVQMWPKETFDKIGYFDERWKACFENMDFALRIFLAGGNVAVTHDVHCLHEHAMTIKSGARNSTYDDYINMPNGFNQELLHRIWDMKWPGLPWSMLYRSPPDEETRQYLIRVFGNNIYLPYIQEVGY